VPAAKPSGDSEKLDSGIGNGLPKIVYALHLAVESNGICKILRSFKGCISDGDAVSPMIQDLL
jgi:hypothetical protein